MVSYFKYSSEEEDLRLVIHSRQHQVYSKEMKKQKTKENIGKEGYVTNKGYDINVYK